MKEIRKLICTLILGLAGATMLMLLINILPTTQMKKHITESVKVMEREGDYHEVLPGVISSRLDNLDLKDAKEKFDKWITTNFAYVNFELL